jgi:hypothetical protein
MFSVTVSHNPPDNSIGQDWPINYAVMAELAREYWQAGDILITASINGHIVGIAHITRREREDRLESLASVFPHAGKLLLGRAIAIAKRDHVRLTLHSRPLPSTIGFYRHFRVLQEVSPLCFVSE